VSRFRILTVKGNPFTGSERKSFHGPCKEILSRAAKGNPFTSLYTKAGPGSPPGRAGDKAVGGVGVCDAKAASPTIRAAKVHQHLGAVAPNPSQRQRP